MSHGSCLQGELTLCAAVREARATLQLEAIVARVGVLSFEYVCKSTQFRPPNEWLMRMTAEIRGEVQGTHLPITLALIRTWQLCSFPDTISSPSLMQVMHIYVCMYWMSCSFAVLVLERWSLLLSSSSSLSGARLPACLRLVAFGLLRTFASVQRASLLADQGSVTNVSQSASLHRAFPSF